MLGPFTDQKVFTFFCTNIPGKINIKHSPVVEIWKHFSLDSLAAAWHEAKYEIIPLIFTWNPLLFSHNAHNVKYSPESRHSMGD